MSPLAKKYESVYAEWMKLPETVVGEILHGELYASPRPSPKHARAASKIGGTLDGPFDSGKGGPGGWWILDEPEIHMDHDILVPDLAGWRKEKMPSLPNEAFFSQAPDWVCEVLSPSTARIDRVLKLPLYAKWGVANVWLVNPIDKTLEILRLEEDKWILVANFGGDDQVRAEPFDAIEIDLALLWT